MVQSHNESANNIFQPSFSAKNKEGGATLRMQPSGLALNIHSLVQLAASMFSCLNYLINNILSSCLNYFNMRSKFRTRNYDPISLEEIGKGNKA